MLCLSGKGCPYLSDPDVNDGGLLFPKLEKAAFPVGAGVTFRFRWKQEACRGPAGGS